MLLYVLLLLYVIVVITTFYILGDLFLSTLSCKFLIPYIFFFFI